MKDSTMSSKDIIMSLLSLQPQMKEYILGSDVEYLPLVGELLKIDYSDDEYHLPTAKELQGKLDVSHGKLRKWLELLHDKLWELFSDERDARLVFGEFDCWMTASYFGSHIYFRIKMPSLPRLGDNINLPFARAKMQGRVNFFVSGVYTNIYGAGIKYDILLDTGIFNAYEWYEDHKLCKTSFQEWMQKRKLHSSGW
jgi:hypothetical protein